MSTGGSESKLLVVVGAVSTERPVDDDPGDSASYNSGGAEGTKPRLAKVCSAASEGSQLPTFHIGLGRISSVGWTGGFPRASVAMKPFREGSIHPEGPTIVGEGVVSAKYGGSRSEVNTLLISFAKQVGRM